MSAMRRPPPTFCAVQHRGQGRREKQVRRRPAWYLSKTAHGSGQAVVYFASRACAIFGRTAMRYRSVLGAMMLATLLASTASAQIVDFSKYPNWKGHWNRFIVRGLPGQPSFDQTKPWGFGQEAPLTGEYLAVLEPSLADHATGGQGNIAD